MSDEAWRGEQSDPMKQMREVIFGRPATPEERAAREARIQIQVALGDDRWERLPVFRRWRPCRKCGHWRHGLSYHPAMDPEQPNPWCVQGINPCLQQAGQRAHFFRQCKRCGHFWWERPR